MNKEQNQAVDNATEGGGLKTLNSDTPEAQTMGRCTCAQLSRFLGLSKARISQLVKDGVVIRGSDGLVDPIQSAKRIHRSVNPNASRSKIARMVAGDLTTFKNEIKELKRQVTDLKTRNEALEASFQFATDDKKASEDYSRLLVNTANQFITLLAEGDSEEESRLRNLWQSTLDMFEGQ